MRCDEVKARLSAYLDGELPPAEAERVKAHLDDCAECRREHADIMRVREMVKDLPSLVAPVELHERVMAEVRRESMRSTESPRVSRWRVLWPAAAAIVLAGLVAVLSRDMARPRQQSMCDRVASEPTPSYAFRGEDSKADEMADVAGSRASGEVQLEQAPRMLAKGEALAEKTSVERESLAFAKAPSVGKAALYRVSDEHAAEVITVAAPDPRSAFDQTVKFASLNNWIAPTEARRAVDANVAPNRPVTQMILFLNDNEVVKLRAELTRIGLQEVAARRDDSFALRREVKKDKDKVLKDETQAPATTVAAASEAAPAESAQTLGAESKERSEPLLRLSNRAVLPAVQSVRTQNAILEDIRNSGAPLRQVTVNILTVEEFRQQQTAPNAVPEDAVPR